MEWAWGLQGLARTADDGGPINGALDQIRSELRGELRSALQLAYLGPKYVPSFDPLPHCTLIVARALAF